MTSPLNPTQFDSGAEDVLGALGGESLRPHPNDMTFEELHAHFGRDHHNWTGITKERHVVLKVLHDSYHEENEANERHRESMKSYGLGDPGPGPYTPTWNKHRHA